MDLSKIRVLAVDDIYANRYLLEDSLQPFNKTVVADPSEFWKALENNIPDIVLLDIMLPNEDGFQIASKMVKSEKYKNIPIIFISAKNNRGSVIEGINSGGTDYIIKPVDEKILTEKIINALTQGLIKRVNRDYSNGREIQFVKTSLYSVFLNGYGTSKFSIISKYIESVTGKNLLDNKPNSHLIELLIVHKITLKEAEKIANDLTALGARCNIAENLICRILGKPLQDEEKITIADSFSHLGVLIVWEQLNG